MLIPFNECFYTISAKSKLVYSMNGLKNKQNKRPFNKYST